MKSPRLSLPAAVGMAILAVVAAGTFARPAVAAMAVIDSSNLAKNAETAATTAKQLIELKNLLETAQSTLKGIGQKGSPIQSVFNMAAGGPGSALGVSYGTAGFYPDLKNLNLPKELGVPNLTNVQGAVAFVRKALEKVNPGDPFATKAEVEQRRARVAYDAVFDNYGVALYHKQTAADSATRISALASQARTATELRQDVQVNTQVALAILEELTGIRSLLAGDLEMRTSARMTTYPATYKKDPTPQVGDVYIPWGNPDAQADGQQQGGSLNGVLGK